VAYPVKYVRLGKSGLKISRITLGCMSYGVPERSAQVWTLNEVHSRPFFKTALELGVNFFDTSNSYSDGTSEEILARAIRDLVRRDEVVIAIKVFYPINKSPNGRGLSRTAIMTAVEASLRRLGTDYIDVYQIHRWDHETPIELCTTRHCWVFVRAPSGLFGMVHRLPAVGQCPHGNDSGTIGAAIGSPTFAGTTP